MTANMCSYSVIVWEWLHDSGQWLPYSSVVTLLLERSNSKNLRSVCLGDGDPQLTNFTVHLKDMVQVSETTESVRPVRRQVYSCQSPAAWGVSWQWNGDDISDWNPYAMEVACVLEDAYRNGLIEINLSNYFPQMNYTVHLIKMIQIKNNSGFQREIKRAMSQSYVMTKSHTGKVEGSASSSGHHVCPMSKSQVSKDSSAKDPVLKSAVSISSLNKCGTKNKIHDTAAVASSSNEALTVHTNKKSKSSDSGDEPKSKTAGMIMKALSAPAKALIHHFNSPMGGGNTSKAKEITSPTLMNKTIMYLPSYLPKSSLQPVPGVEASSAVNKRIKRKHWDESFDQATGEEILASYSNQFKKYNSEEACCICCESLSSVSGYGDDSTVAQLKICQHSFHKLCILAMHESSNQAQYLQCPTCKSIHGVKTGNQPFGKIDYHVIPYSLPTFECHTIRIIYDIAGGIQTYEHPNPGKRYSARGFPRVCYLPDDEDGRKVLRLLIKAWERRLVFTIGSSVTSGETDTVTWNEIHHKTEFGSNFTGHGYPDKNYIDNVLLELASQGIIE